MPHHDDDAAFKDLWSRRNTLNIAEWDRLYRIVAGALTSYRHQIFSSLNEEHEIYVQEFFQDKVFRRDLLGRLDHVGALRVAYKRYLYSQYESQILRRTEELPGGDAGADEGPALANPGSDGNLGDDQFKALTEAGVSPQEAGDSATKWLVEAEPWVPAMLGLHYCPDREHAEPLVKLRKRLGIRSYHSKAEKLGITGVHNPIWGEESMIGRWVTQGLGIEISLENHELVHSALKILCFAALTWAEQREAAP